MSNRYIKLGAKTYASPSLDRIAYYRDANESGRYELVTLIRRGEHVERFPVELLPDYGARSVSYAINRCIEFI
jgi:hypothetical protein